MIVYNNSKNRMGPEHKPDRKLQIVAVSDTHSSFKTITDLSSMKGDIFIHAGDFTSHGRQNNFIQFFQAIDSLQFKNKIVICGNHQITMDNGTMKDHYRQKFLTKYPCQLTKHHIVQQLKKRCVYLEHEATEIEGVKIFGSPYSPVYCNTAFQYQSKLDQVIWSKVPKQIDILVTHTPPLGILDKSHKGKNCGSKALKTISMIRKPKYHIFGHIHQAYGMQKIDGITFVNVAKNPTRLIFSVKSQHL